MSRSRVAKSLRYLLNRRGGSDWYFQATMVQQDGFWVARGWCLLFQVLPSQSLCCSMLQHGPRQFDRHLWLAYSTCSNSQSLFLVDVKCFPLLIHRRKSDQHTPWSTTHVFCMFGSSWKVWAGQVNLDQHVICFQAVASACHFKDIEKMNKHVQWMKSLETDTSSVWKSWTSWKACAACSLLPALPSNTLTLHDFVATLCRFTTLWGVAFNRMPRACTKESWWDLAAVPAIPFKGTIGKDLLDIKFTLAKHGVKQIL